jgi:hypothetical protein
MPTEELERELRRAFASAAAGYPHPEQARQRLLQHNYRPGSGHRRLIASITVIASAGSMALALSLSGALGGAPARGTGTIGTAAPARNAGRSGNEAPARGTGRIQTAAFTLTSNANGTDTLTLRLTMRRMFDPAGLQQVLTRHGIPAVVKIDTFCSSTPAAPDPASIGVLSVRPPIKPHLGLVPARNGPAPSALKQLAARTVMVINPAAIPSGTKLFFDYSSSGHTLFTSLINTSSYTCRAGHLPATP